MADKVILVFNKPHKGYHSGDKAGFSPAEAAQLIAKKYARPFEERGAVVSKTVTKKKAKKRRRFRGGDA